MDLTGTPVGRDVDVLKSLMALRRDTTRTNANGEFTFENVPFGAYTVEAEAYANDKFMQWSADAAVIPNVTARVTLDGKVLSENQYCAATAAPDTSKIYNENELDQPLEFARVANDAAPPFGRGAVVTTLSSDADHSRDVTIEFVVARDGVPDPHSVKLTKGSISMSAAERLIDNMRFRPPTVQGVPVNARTSTSLVAMISEVHVQRTP
jgi:hypothetical protein